MTNDSGEIQELQNFKFTWLPTGDVALLLAYATSAEALSKNEMQSFVIGMTRDKAHELAAKLKAFADSPFKTSKRQTEH